MAPAARLSLTDRIAERAPLVELRGLSKSYDGRAVVEAVDLTIPPGQFVVLLGPSGSGKTTLLSMLGGFTPPTAGRVLIGGADVTEAPPARRPTATVFQDYALFPHMSVARNVAFGLAMRGMPRIQRLSRAEELLRLVGLAGFGARAIHQLSGGQRQRVALARALAVEPAVLLLDEPLGALDLALRRQMQAELLRVQRALGTVFIHVTHDQDEAMSLADLVVVLNQGRIEDAGPPRRVYLQPATLFAATFMGESNLLPGRIAGRGEAGTIDVETGLGPMRIFGEGSPGEAVTLSIRPEQIAIAPDTPEMMDLGPARITEATFQGTHLRCTAQAEADASVRLLLRLPPAAVLPPDGAVQLYTRASDITLLRG